MTDITIYRCSECLRCFGSETAILDHQSLWGRLHAHDPEIDEHDGIPWSVEKVQPGGSIEYRKGRVEFVRPDREGFIFYGYPGGRERVEVVGTFDEVYVPRVDAQLVLAWAAAQALGLDGYEHNEVSMEWYAHNLTMLWHKDLKRLAEEQHWMLSMIGLVSVMRSNAGPRR